MEDTVTTSHSVDGWAQPSHVRSVDVHRLQAGYVSSHFRCRMLFPCVSLRTAHQQSLYVIWAPVSRVVFTYRHVLQPLLDRVQVLLFLIDLASILCYEQLIGNWADTEPEETSGWELMDVDEAQGEPHEPSGWWLDPSFSVS
jgi:hypothetical protein